MKMSLSVVVDTISNLKGCSDRFLRMRFRGDSRETSVTRSVKDEWKPNEKQTWYLQSSVNEEEVVIIEAYNKSRIFAPKFVGRCLFRLKGINNGGKLSQSLAMLDDNNEATEMAILVNIDHSTYSPGDAVSKASTPSIARQEKKIRPSLHEEKRKELFHPTVHQRLPKSTEFEDWQVHVRVTEGRDLAGLRIDPYIEVSVGDKKEVTEAKHQDNNPRWEAAFVFIDKLPREAFLDQLLTIQAFSSSLVGKKLIGKFVLDLWHVYDHQGHGWNGKWAVLNDTKSNAVKGYVKVDIFIKERGSTDTEPEPNRSEYIERNLLLPRGLGAVRNVSEYKVHIYKATGLPKLSTKLITNLKKQLTGKIKSLADSYVEVAFAGMTGSTKIVTDTCSPEFYQTIIFHEFLPSMCSRIRIRVKDGDSISGESIGTHFIDLKEISCPGCDGLLAFPPTFGPSWIHLYGSSRDYSFFDENLNLNDGVGEGISYRGRLLISIECQESSSTETGKVEVKDFLADQIPPREDGYLSSRFTLFAALYEGSMINRRYEDKPIQFEISIGEYGFNSSDLLQRDDKGSRGTKAAQEFLRQGLRRDLIPDDPDTSTCSLAGPFDLRPSKKEFLYIPFGLEKPCIFYTFKLQDQTMRLYIKSMLHNICMQLEEEINKLHEKCCRGGGSEVSTWSMLEEIRSKSSVAKKAQGRVRWHGVVDGLYSTGTIGLKKLQENLKASRRVSSPMSKEAPVAHKSRFYELAERQNGGMNWSWNELDDFLADIRISELKWVQRTSNLSEKEAIKEIRSIAARVKRLMIEPQQTLPDVFIWMICGGRRVAYSRIPAEEVFYSPDPLEEGYSCGKLQTIFLQLPEKKGDSKRHWNTQIKLDVLLWLGRVEDESAALREAPIGYEIDLTEGQDTLPTQLNYKYNHQFILRAHMFQGRGLFGSDDSGFSDPFAKVIFGDQSKKSTHRRQTRNPTWNHMLKFTNLRIPGSMDYIIKNPPVIVVEIYDKDPGGEVEIIGKALARPVVKKAAEKYEPPLYPPPLDWFPIYLGRRKAGDLLASFELLEDDYNYQFNLPEEKEDETDGGALRKSIPKELLPLRENYRVEILFWGIREIKNRHVFKRPQVRLGCCYPMIVLGERNPTPKTTIFSKVCPLVRENPNFGADIVTFDVELPKESRYKPPLTLSVVNQGSFKRMVLVGSDLINSIQEFVMDREMTERIIQRLNAERLNESNANNNEKLPFRQTTIDINEDALKKEEEIERSEKKREEEGGITLDWWTRFNASNTTGESPEDDLAEKEQAREKGVILLKIYLTELEKVKEFGGFKDFFQTFLLRKGKMSDQLHEETRIIGKVKASLRVWDTKHKEIMENTSPTGTFLWLPRSDPFHLLVRVYCIRAFDLVPADPNGKADPYLTVRVGKHKKGNRDEAVKKTLNPEFGKCFEFDAHMPFDSIVTIKVMDHDYGNGDDFIGKTTIDLEDRYYSRHRATCGLQEKFTRSGYAKWRDPEKPTMILSKLCKKEGLPKPVYEKGFCRIGNQKFPKCPLKDDSCISNQDLALCALQKADKLAGYHLVPEHVETRNLYHPGRKDVPQGRLQLWIDMFRIDESAPPPPVDITLRKPEQYELRVIIWNTEGIEATESNPILGIRSSDIFVKGWLEGMENDKQDTDVHYRSTNGVGMFNWRFIFPVLLHIAERKIVTKRKLHFYDIDSVVQKHRPYLHLEVWDADIILSNDFLGKLTLDLTKLKPPAKTASSCSLKKFEAETKYTSLVKCKKARGWWPFADEKNNPAGVVEAELELIPESEAEARPVGKKRKEPEALQKPDRPADSVNLFLGPLRVVQLLICNHKGCIIKAIVLIFFIFIIVIFFYAMPGYSVKKLFQV